MARLQILELPEGSSDDRPPFVLVIDEHVPQRYVLGPDQPEPVDQFERITEKIGARAVLVFEETIDIPGNDTTAYLAAPSTTPEFRVELGGQDPPKVIDATLRNLKDSVNLDGKRTEITRDMYWLAKRKQELTDALGMDRLRDWEDIRNAAAGIRKQRDEQAEAIERVRQLHQSVDYRGAVICRECSAYAGGSADNAPVAHDKCVTLQALTGRQPTMICDITVDNAAEVVASHDPSRRA